MLDEHKFPVVGDWMVVEWLFGCLMAFSTTCLIEMRSQECSSHLSEVIFLHVLQTNFVSSSSMAGHTILSKAAIGIGLNHQHNSMHFVNNGI